LRNNIYKNQHFHPHSQDMLLLASTVSSRFYNCCTDGSTSPENYRYSLVYYTLWTSVSQTFLLKVTRNGPCFGVVAQPTVRWSLRSLCGCPTHTNPQTKD
jgi:hypothetical protein